MIFTDRKIEEKPRFKNYEIVEHIGLVRENHNGKNKVELNLIKWEGRPAVYDLRLWIREEDGTYSPAKGLKLYYEDLLILNKILADL